MLPEHPLPSRQHAKQLLQEPQQTVAMRASRHTADVRKAFDPQQPAATQVHAVHAQLTRGTGQCHRRCHGAQEGAAAGLRCAQHRDMTAALVQIEQPRLLPLLCWVVQQPHGNQQRTVVPRLVVGEYAG